MLSSKGSASRFLSMSSTTKIEGNQNTDSVKLRSLASNLRVIPSSHNSCSFKQVETIFIERLSTTRTRHSILALPGWPSPTVHSCLILMSSFKISTKDNRFYWFIQQRFAKNFISSRLFSHFSELIIQCNNNSQRFLKLSKDSMQQILEIPKGKPNYGAKFTTELNRQH